MESFIEYMWYLLITPLKKVKKSINHWYTLCKVVGKRFDEAKESILVARDEGMVATCSHDMLAVHGADRKLSRYTGEDPENFRSRIAMHEEVCALGGLNEGIILAVKSLGYKNPIIKSAVEFKGDRSRWAEFYLIIVMNVDEQHPIAFSILRNTVREWKEVGARDNYYMEYRTQIREPNKATVKRIQYTKFIYFYDYLKLDGKWQTDGTYLMDSVVHSYPTRIGFKYVSEYMLHYARLSKDEYRNSHRYVMSADSRALFKQYADYFDYLKLDGSWDTDGNRLMDAVVYLGGLSWVVRYMAEHSQSADSRADFSVEGVKHNERAGKKREEYRLISDYFVYLKLNGLWSLTGSRNMDSQRVEYKTTQSYRTGVEHKKAVTVTWHEEHNLFFCDGTWDLDGSKVIDAYQKTEVL